MFQYKHQQQQYQRKMPSAEIEIPPSPNTPGLGRTAQQGFDYEGGGNGNLAKINFENDKFPFCIVWTPIPVLTWILPMIGHMGICMSNGVIRDFAGPYFVSEDNMGFGRPTRYLQLNPAYVEGGRFEWDEAVSKASVLYGTRMHNLFCDNCHSHVATALCGMRYKNNTSWNMIVLAFWMFFCGRFVGFWGFVKSFLPFMIAVTAIVLLIVYF